MADLTLGAMGVIVAVSPLSFGVRPPGPTTASRTGATAGRTVGAAENWVRPPGEGLDHGPVTFYLLGGPPRVGKSTLARQLLEQHGIAGCPTDVLVSMLQAGAPELGVRHGTHLDKAASMHRLLIEFIGCYAGGSSCYLLEGDVVTPALAVEAARRVGGVRAVFLGSTSLTISDLRISPHWLQDADDAEYARIRDWVIQQSAALRRECEKTGSCYIDMGQGRERGLHAARNALGL